jgi:uncharacterized PurR-regulated membrane protein YhhQ (DUF165 family)
MRTIGSTVVGEGVDSIIFYPLAFFILPSLLGFTDAIWPAAILIAVTINNYLLKVLLEVLATPVTYAIVGKLKESEHEDVYDRDTDFNPFLLGEV